MPRDPFEKTVEARLHVLATKMVVEAARQSAEKYDSAGNDIVRDALHAISQDATITHRAVATLVRAGWSGSAAGLLRTLFDLLIAATAITNSRNPHLMAFQYFYSGYRRMGRDDKRYDATARRRAREETRNRIRRLPAEQRQPALAFIKDRDRPYFFNPEWRSPTDVLGKIQVEDLPHVYSQLSAAAHGGFQGVRLFRDKPDERGINPQVPPGPHARSVLLISSRLLVELTSLRGAVEGLRLGPIEAALRTDIRRAAGYA